LNGFCGPQKPLWFKLAMFPLAWTGKMQQLAHVRREIAVSLHDADKMRRWYFPFRKKISQLYHSRLRLDALTGPAPAREKLVLNVGHVAWRKGQLFLTEHPDWNLSLVGAILEPDIVEKIHALAQAHRLQDRIQLPGERTDTLAMMRRAGIYVQPSYYEALGLALQEALFAGCPGIGTRVGGIPELIEQDKTGLLVSAGNVEQLAQALDTLMSDAALREAFGQAGAASIIEKGMTVDKMTENHLQLYETILNGT
jgi:glycosyltransferase involved in cell wall biosynthesis